MFSILLLLSMVVCLIFLFLVAKLGVFCGFLFSRMGEILV